MNTVKIISEFSGSKDEIKNILKKEFASIPSYAEAVFQYLSKRNVITRVSKSSFVLHRTTDMRVREALVYAKNCIVKSTSRLVIA